ncbi:MAG TPA: hypothetical protein DCL74_00055 [Succinivibrionaceae bacterium]|nr:hypothetical protein [Succinivibrionaceae bacterium]
MSKQDQDLQEQDEAEVTASVGEQPQFENAPIDDEIERIMKAAGAVVLSLEHMRDLISKKESVQDPEALLKIIRPMSMNVENSLPALHDFMDNLEAVGEDEKASEVRRIINRIEDELLPGVLEFLNTNH